MLSRLHPLLMMFLLVGFTSGGGVLADETELFLTNKYELAAKDDAVFLRKLAKNIHEILNPVITDYTAHRIHYVKADLNGDGVEELLVEPSTSYFCGNNPTCETSIYTRSADGWAYIGGASSLAKINSGWRFITVEDEWHNGWRTLNDGEFRFCWVPSISTDKSKMYMYKDPLGMPVTPGQGGYFSSVELKEKCTEG